MKELIEKWVADYVTSSDMRISDDALWHTAFIDRITVDSTSFKYFRNLNSFLKYLLMRYAPKIYNFFFYRK